MSPHQRRFRQILYRCLGPGIILAFFLSATSTVAQEEVPEITPRAKTATKPGPGPRALGLLQLASNGKASLIPIAIRVNGKFYDATAYKATPIPMALDSGTVYEGERTGNSVGLFTINGALRSQAANAAAPWIGTGMWLPMGSDAPKTGLKAERVPLGIETTDEPPRLTKSGSQRSTPRTSTPSSPQTTSVPASGSAPPATVPTQSPTASPTDKSPESKENDKDKTTKPSEQSSRSADQPQTSGDNNRPRLRRGKPTQPLPSDEEVPGYSKPNSAGIAKSSATAGTSASGTSTSGTPTVHGVQEPMQLVPAISDADGPDPRPYVFEWNKGEEEDRRKQMLALAKEQLRSYLSSREKLTTKPSLPSHPAAWGRKAAAKSPEPVLDNVQMRTFDLWGNNQPVLILGAEAHVPAAAAAKAASTPSPADAATQYSITLAARVDIYGNLRKLYSGVTDKYHLDVAPRLELIDAVDADGDGRGELLFRETTDAASGYVIYRATADTLWKMYDSLNPE